MKKMVYGSYAVVIALAVVPSLLLKSGCATFGGKGLSPVTVPQIVEMSKAGISAEEIVGKISDSGTVYRLAASQLAELKEKGVPDAVIDYMQQTYIDAVRRDQSREDLSHWTQDEYGYWYGGWPYGWEINEDKRREVERGVERDREKFRGRR